MKVTFAQYGDGLASSRLRAKIPQQELGKRGIGVGNDVLVYGKHFLHLRDTAAYKQRIFDICDDHFDHEELGLYYREHAAVADKLTCNSDVMCHRIKAVTGRDATVIPEPYEAEEREPSIGPLLCWYGHKSNLPDFHRIASGLRHPTIVLTNEAGYPQWNPGNFKRAMEVPCIVIIPTGKSMAKSENRMVEAVRNGKYVCAESLQAYELFQQFFPLIDIPTHVEHVLQNLGAAMDAVRAAQDYIRDTYSPSAIADKWLKVIEK